MSVDDDLLPCRLCGRSFASLGHHVARAHAMSADDYRDQFGIRRGVPLTGKATRERFSAAIRKTIDSGSLDPHFATNAVRSSMAAQASREVKRRLRASGIDLPQGTAPTPRETIEAIIAAIEAGAGVATAVKRSPISYSGFHGGLARHPDLQARLQAAKRRIG